MDKVERSFEKVHQKREVNPIRNMIANNNVNYSMEVKPVRKKARYERKEESVRYDNNKIYGNQNKIRNRSNNNSSLKLP